MVVSFSTLVIISLLSIIIGMIMGISLSRGPR
jgi:hypothetical protein